MTLTILTQVRENGLVVFNFFNSWAVTVSALFWANIAGILAQVDIPAEVWGQYPLILIGVGLVAYLARYWVANEREWRTFTTQQVTDRESANLRTLQLIQTNNEQWLKILGDNHSEQIELIEKGHQEQLRLQREGLREVFDAELERVLDLLAKAGHYDTQRKRNLDDLQSPIKSAKEGRNDE